MRISASPHASCWTISWRRLSRARINQWRCVPAARQSNRNAAEKYARSNRSLVILAAQLVLPGSIRRSPWRRAWHQAFRGCVCPSGKWRGSAARARGHAGCCSRPVRLGILRGVRGRPDHTIHSQHAQWLAYIHRGDGSRLGSVERTARPKALAQALVGLHADQLVQAALVHPGQIQLLHHLPQWPISKQRQSDHKPHGMLRAGSLRRRMEALPLSPAPVRSRWGSINAPSCSRRSGTGQGLAQGVCKQAIISGNVLNTPFTGSTACGLN